MATETMVSRAESRKAGDRRRYLLNREKRCQQAKEYRKTHAEKVRASERKSYLRNRKQRLAYQKKYAKLNPEKALVIQLRSKYGITLDAFNEKLIQQRHACAVCKKNPPNKHQRLHIDHDHNTGNIRGLLCSQCNTAIGLAKENPTILRSLAEYLERHQ